MRERPIALCSGDGNTPWWWGSVTIMEAYRSVIMEAFMDRFTAAELLSYKEVLYDEATEGWYAPHEVEGEEHNCMRLARQFYHLVEEYRERFFPYVLFQSPTQSAATHLESYILHVYYTSQLDNDNNKELDQLELDWITWQRDYLRNLKQYNVIWLNRENLALGASDWYHVVARMQLKCRVQRRFVDESGIRERYERYISKAVIDGTINYTPISFEAIHSVCALPEPSKNTELFNMLYT